MLPVIVTEVPPAGVPVAGEMPVTVGAAAAMLNDCATCVAAE